MPTSKRLIARAGLTGITAAAVLLIGSTTSAAGPPKITETQPVSWSVDNVTAQQYKDLLAAGFDVVDQTPEGKTIIIGDQSVADDLRDEGYEPSFWDTVYKPIPQVEAQEYETYYGGYHTVEAHEQHLTDVAAEYPELATMYDIGDSWLKTQGEGGHDILAICITKKSEGDCELSPDSEKPRFSLIAQIHAREIATGEVAWKWIDSLVAGYGTDEDITQLMDTTEMWVVPIVNPDGVDIVASGGDSPILQRKNANDTNGSCSSSTAGIDLNRNSSYEWGSDSSNPCSQTYQGPSPASEPEVAAIEGLLRDIHPDQRDEDPTAPAPADTRDVFISLHSYGEYIIVPWGYTDATAPNDAALRALGAKMSESNGYFVGTNDDTVGYATSGTTDDMSYGELGIASFTFEMGGSWGSCGGFTPSYSCVDSTLWPENQGALMTAAQAASAPYAQMVMF